MNNSDSNKKSIDTSYKIYFKHDGCTMLFMDHLTQGGAIAFKKTFEKWAEEKNKQYHGKFIVRK